jgi:hypothetical protein
MLRPLPVAKGWVSEGLHPECKILAILQPNGDALPSSILLVEMQHQYELVESQALESNSDAAEAYSEKRAKLLTITVDTLVLHPTGTAASLGLGGPWIPPEHFWMPHQVLANVLGCRRSWFGPLCGCLRGPL